MVMSAKKIWIFLFAVFAFALFGAEKQWNIISADGADIAFRNILIKKSVQGEVLSCSVTQDNVVSALKKLVDGKADIVLVKDFAEKIKDLPDDLECIQFDNTMIMAVVNRANPLNRMKLSDLQHVWNGDFQEWNIFDKNNVFSIHRFGMRLDDSIFQYIRKDWGLKNSYPHFPLDSAQQVVLMVKANPNAVGIIVFEEDIDYDGVKFIQLTDDNNKNIVYRVPHSAIFRKKNRAEVNKFLGRQGK